MYPARLARELRERGADAERVDERSPLRGLADEELLVVAAHEETGARQRERRRLHAPLRRVGAAGRRHAGIVIALSSRFSRTPAGYEVLVDSLVELCAQRPGREALADAVHFLVRA